VNLLRRVRSWNDIFKRHNLEVAAEIMKRAERRSGFKLAAIISAANGVFLGATRDVGQRIEDSGCFAAVSLSLIGICCDKAAHKAVPFGTP
jgi:hypothetical protein